MRSPVQRSLAFLIAVLMVEVVVVWPATVHAQSTTGTITGRVTDAQGLAAPGTTVVAASPNLQGTRTTVTLAAGDYILSLLPAGTYVLTFELPGFAPARQEDRLAPAQTLIVDATLAPAPVNAIVQVTSVAADAFVHTAQAGATFSQSFLSDLPTNRDIVAALQLAPSLHATGPLGAYSIAGGMSFANLILLNGVSITDNLRGQLYDLYIEDAIEQVNIGTAGISADYGRFTGGVVNIITKSGGNRFSGSLRDTLVNDRWRTLTPSEHTIVDADPRHPDTRIDKTVPTYEYTLGGPVRRDRVWFFAAGRNQTQETGRNLVSTGIPYTYTLKQRRYEGKATWAITPGHRLQGSAVGIHEEQLGQSVNPSIVMDTNSLYDEVRPMNLFTLAYDGNLSSNLSVEARVSARNETLKGVGGTSRDPVLGTVLIDTLGRRYWSATFCGVCEPEQRDGEDVFVKGSYFLTSAGPGSHTMSFGYDGYNDRRFANNHQSGSDFRIVSTTALIRDSKITAQFLTNKAQIYWQPVLVPATGTNFRTHSGFYSDTWRISDRISANLGLRYDHNHSVDSSARLVANTGTWSPRAGVIVDVRGDNRWTITASVGKYVEALANTVANASSPGGNADTYQFAYGGPSINADPDAPLTSTADGIRQVLDWFEDNHQQLAAVMARVNGVTPIIGDSLKAPSAVEYAGGVSRQFGGRAAVRVNVNYRRFGNFYSLRTDSSTGTVFDTRPQAPPEVVSREYDLSVLENSDLLSRQYAGLSLHGQSRIAARLDAGATYTLSRLWGNFDGEASNGPAVGGALQYPEYKQPLWSYPTGDLSIDQRHRARLWVRYGPPRMSGLTISALQILESGVPFGAVSASSGANPSLSVKSPVYLTPPTALTTQYYFTNRDAFRTEGQRRTDIAVGYVHAIGSLEVFGQVQVLNVFDQFQLCACGAATALQDGTAVDLSRLDTSVVTSATSGQYVGFDPMTTVPVEGVNWAKSPTFGQAVIRTAYTTPRTMRLTFGVRF